jgi:hypothetical protein
MFSGTVNMTKFNVTGIYVYLCVFLSLSPYHVLSELTHRQDALFFMLYILCLIMNRVLFKASAALSGCYKNMSHTLDSVWTKDLLGKGTKQQLQRKINSYSIFITFMTLIYSYIYIFCKCKKPVI